MTRARFDTVVLALMLIVCMSRLGLSEEAPLVDSKAAKTRFAEITDQDMELLTLSVKACVHGSKARYLFTIWVPS